MLRLLVSLLVFAALLASVTAAPVPTHLMPKEDPIYFPTQVGTKWVYVYQQDNREAEHEVTEIEKQKDGSLVVAVKYGTSSMRWQVSRSGVAMLSDGSYVPDSPALLLKMPLPADGKWEVAGGKVSPAGQLTAHGVEEVKVPAGTFQAMRVECQWGNQQPVTFWFARKVGIVKTAGSGFDKELKSFTLPKK